MNNNQNNDQRSTREKQHDYYSNLANQRGRNPSGNRAPQRGANAPQMSTMQSNPQAQRGNAPKKKKKMSKTKKALISIIAILLVIVLAVGGTGFFYLNKVNHDDGTLTTAPTNPNASAEEEAAEADVLNGGSLSADESSALSDADKSINANLDDSGIWHSDSVKNILLMGIDYGSSNYPYGRSDSMIIVSINEKTNNVKLISLSRAVYAAIPGYNNTRLSHAHGYGGAALAIKAIENNYKIKIDNYASVNFASFEKIIDALGGVTITLSDAEANAISGVLGHSSGGTYNLNGAQALAFARTRKIDTDRNRTGRQRRVLEALANKAKNMPTQLISSMDDVLQYVTTDMSNSQLLAMASKAMTYLNYSREEYVIPHKSSDLTLRGGFDVLLVDWEDEVKYVHELIYKDVEASVS